LKRSEGISRKEKRTVEGGSPRLKAPKALTVKDRISLGKAIRVQLQGDEKKPRFKRYRAACPSIE